MKRQARAGDIGAGALLGVPAFAPQFTVYVLPPSTVCLYSEGRKFLLHGELYCALAAEIDGTRKLSEIVRTLKRRYSERDIRRALRRLTERGFIVAARWRDPNAAFWANLGIAPQLAARRLADCTVVIEDFGTKASAALARSLHRLGVRLGSGAAAHKLIIALVTDYQDPRLVEFNRARLRTRESWMLVQPTGIFPLLGPRFKPGESACWECLAVRMRGNREVRAFLEQQPDRRIVAASMLQHSRLGTVSTELAALEIAKAIASDWGTQIREHVLSIDLPGAAIAKHYVMRRPQCPTCGKRRARQTGRAAHPIRLQPGAKTVFTSGGRRVRTPLATVEALQKHVSPLSGIVSRIDRAAAEPDWVHTYYAYHNFGPTPASLDHLRRALYPRSAGKGATAEQGQASALGEAIERYSGLFQGDEPRVRKRYRDFRAGQAIHPDACTLYSDAQYSSRGRSGETPAFLLVPEPFDADAETDWSPVWSLTGRQTRYLPTGYLYYDYRGPRAECFFPNSNGAAAGNTLEEAISQGFLELVERDAFGIWWYNRLQRPGVALDSFAHPYLQQARSRFAQVGRSLWLIDLTNDLGIPAFVAVSHRARKGLEDVALGSGAHFDPQIAALRAITEVNQSMPAILAADRAGRIDDADHSGWWRKLKLTDHPYLAPNGEAERTFASATNNGPVDQLDEVALCVEFTKRKGLDLLVADQTRPDIGLPVAKVVVPGLRHYWPRFAAGRLYDVPLEMGLMSRKLQEDELNAFYPAV